MTGLEALKHLKVLLEDIWAEEYWKGEHYIIKKELTTKSKKEQAFDYLIKNNLIWLDNGKLKIGRMFDVEIELDETYFDTKEEFNLLKEVMK